MKIIKLYENFTSFKKWFGESVMKDESNKPIIFYHSSDNDFNIFDINKTRKGWLSKGFYFSSNKDDVEHYGDKLYKVYLKIENPFIVHRDIINDDGTVTFGKSFKELVKEKYPEINNIIFSEYSNFLKDKGYDGIINGYLITVFDPNQIKSVENSGNYSLFDNNIYN